MKLLTILLLMLLPLVARGGEMDATEFSAMLENATLEGTWAPVSGDGSAGEKPDRYHIVRADPKGGDRWAIVWKVRVQGQVVEYPIATTVKFAGDVAVLVLDEVPVGDGSTWSARIMFHDDTYTGRWWNANGKGGTVSGLIQRD